MSITVKPSELQHLLARMIPAKMPVLITGAPGIGKSDIVAQAAERAEADVILSHPAVADPTDAKGLPWVVNGKADFLPFGELDRAIKAEKPTVWFLDDLGQASPAVQSSFMQLLLARRVNGHALSEHVTFVAATNRRTDRAGVTGILEPVKSRFHTIVELEPNLDESCAFAIDHDWAPMIIAFWRFQPDLLCKFTPSADLHNCPLPRTWSHVDKIIKLEMPMSIQHQAIAGAIGEGAATEFTAFVKLYLELPSIDKILDDPNSVPIPQQPAVLYALAGALAHRTTKENFAKVSKFVERMVSEGRGEFGVLTVRDAVRRHSDITSTQAFAKLATGELGQLISWK